MSVTSETSIRLDNKTALVTGAGSGIGFAIARALAGAGATVLLNDLDTARAEEAAQKIGAQPMPGDICAGRFAEEVAKLPVGILVNNAGFQHVSAAEGFPPEVFRRMIDTMLVAPFFLSAAALPRMKERGWGRIINVGSVHSKIASPFKAGYVAAKHGILGLTRTLALEAAPFGVTVNAICPGYVDTPLVRQQLPFLARTHGLPEEEVLEKVVLRAVPMKRLIDPSEIAAYALFLCSDAARSITAQGCTIDAGWSQI